VTGNQKGYMSERVMLQEVGYIQSDFMSYDFNDPGVERSDNDQVGGKRRKKLATLGGAIAAYVAVDEFTGYVFGRLVKSVASPIQLIVELFAEYEKNGHQVRQFAADEGVSSSSNCRVMTTEVERYIIEKRCKLVKADPHNHRNGTAEVERMIQTIKNRMRMAFQYALANQNITRLGYSVIGIMKMWGEMFMWAVEVENMKMAKGNDRKSKFEMFTGMIPNIQERRMLPIFAVIKVHRESGKTREDASEGGYYQYALYCGPCPFGKGVIRAAIVQGGRVSILRTSKYKGVSDGGDAYQPVVVGRGIENVVRDHMVGMSEGESEDQFGRRGVNEIEDSNEEVKNGDNVNRGGGRQTRFSGLKHVNVYSALDWTTYESDEMMFDPVKGEVVIVTEDEGEEVRKAVDIDAFVVVREGIPKNFRLALSDPRWGEAARNEFNTITNVMGTLVKIGDDDAKMLIRAGADKVILFPIYERKIKEGNEVLKVRLVGNGKTQFKAGQTYSPTPTRTEFMMLLHVSAALGWVLVHLDETRAFLSSRYSGETRVVAKVGGMNESWDVIGALYGLRTSPRDYRREVLKRLNGMGFVQAQACSCIFRNDQGVIIFDFVDDFVMGGKNKCAVEEAVRKYRTLATTTSPIWDPQVVLGHELSRNLERREITVSLRGKIMEVVEEWMSFGVVKRKVPLAKGDYLVSESDLEVCAGSEYLDDNGRRLYQKIVGQLVWIHGVRMDLSFVMSYLTGYTFKPRKHHFSVAIGTVGYLWETVELVLVLGGDLNVRAYSDSSHGTSRDYRSVCGSVIKLSEQAGAVIAKSVVSIYVRLSSFEAEMEAMNVTIKLLNWILKVKVDLIGKVAEIPVVYGDNKSMVDFVKGDGEAKGVRHIEMKMYYVREEYLKKKFELEFMRGEIIPADLLTKVGSRSDFERFRGYILGYMNDKIMTEEGVLGRSDGLPCEGFPLRGSSVMVTRGTVGCVGGK
jgi:hypothetical protein